VFEGSNSTGALLEATSSIGILAVLLGVVVEVTVVVQDVDETVSPEVVS